MFTLYQMPGWGSAIVEMQLEHYGLPCRLVEAGDVFANAEARARLAAINPLAQVPTLILPSGAVMTESAAITLHLADVTGRDDLVPGPGAVERAAFLRWLVFLVANIYPTFTYADVPTRFVTDAGAAAAFRERLDLYQKDLWRQVACAVGEAGGPWFLGSRFSALDLYIAVMTRWRPREDWFAAEAPGLVSIARAVRNLPSVTKSFARNFP